MQESYLMVYTFRNVQHSISIPLQSLLYLIDIIVEYCGYYSHISYVNHVICPQN